MPTDETNDDRKPGKDGDVPATTSARQVDDASTRSTTSAGRTRGRRGRAAGTDPGGGGTGGADRSPASAGRAKGIRLTDETLVRAAQRGDRQAFRELVRRYQGPLLNFTYRFVADRARAEDLVQETFLRVYRNIHRYKTVARFSTWIYTIAGNLAKNEIRNTKRRKTVSIEGLSHDLYGDEMVLELPDPTQDPVDDVERRQLSLIIEEAVRKLPARYRTVFMMRDVTGLSYEEIARSLKVPVGTVKSRVNRARQRFKTLVEPHLDDLYTGNPEEEGSS
jgi:RNA polymerase sigma-70 factor (ECF subfamily)